MSAIRDIGLYAGQHLHHVHGLGWIASVYVLELI